MQPIIIICHQHLVLVQSRDDTVSFQTLTNGSEGLNKFTDTRRIISYMLQHSNSKMSYVHVLYAYISGSVSFDKEWKRMSRKAFIKLSRANTGNIHCRIVTRIQVHMTRMCWRMLVQKILMIVYGQGNCPVPRLF